VRVAATGNIVAVTEGALDCLWVWQAGHPAVGLLGSGMWNKVSLMDDYALALFFDKDAAGMLATQEAGRLMWRTTMVTVARYPRGVEAKDPQDLSIRQVDRALARAVPYATWRMKRKVRRLQTNS
jgi:DNA primase